MSGDRKYRKSKRVLLGEGPHRSAQPEDDASRAHARSLFFEAIRTVERQKYGKPVLATLCDVVFPVFKRAILPRDPVPEWWLVQQFTELVKRTDPSDERFLPPEENKRRKAFAELGETLLHWLDRWHINGDGIHDYALRTLRLWQQSPDARKGLEIYHDTAYPELDEEHPLIIREPGWRPWLESRAAYRHRFLHNVADALNKYLDNFERDWPPARTKANLLHFEWTVRRHVQSWTNRQIAEEYQSEKGIDAQTIGEAIARTAKLVGLKPLHNKPGRPRKL